MPRWKLHSISLLLLASIAYGQAEQEAWDDLARGDTLAWAEHYTGQDENDKTDFDLFESVAIIPTAEGEDEIWVVVKRTIDGNEVRYIEQFQPVDWGSDQNDCWFVDCAGDIRDVWVGGIPGTPGTIGDYPVLYEVDDQADPGLAHDVGLSTYQDLVDTFTNEDMDLQFSVPIADRHDEHYYLTNDIDMSATQSEPNGWMMKTGLAHGGTFDGCGYTLSNMYQNRPHHGNHAQEGGGFFTSIGATAIVANLNIIDAELHVANGGVLAREIRTYITGEEQGANVYNCHVSGTIYMTDTDDNPSITAVGGMVGDTYVSAGNDDVEFFDCTTNVDIVSVPQEVLSVNRIGGFIGGIWCDIGFYNCQTFGDVEATGYTEESQYVGGFIGYDPGIYDTTIWDCNANGDVTGDNYVGGFTGGYSAERYYQCSAVGDVICTTEAGGGFIGRLSRLSYIYDCYAWGDVTGGDIIGGFVGKNYTGRIYRAYSIGEVTGTTLGGFTGDDVYGVAGVYYCYWDTETSGIETSDDGTGRGTISMKTRSLYDDSWDFDTIWDMVADVAAVPAVPGYWDTIDVAYDHLEGRLVCVYADGRPVGSYTVVDGELSGFDESEYTTITAGLNYYSIYESFPLIIGSQGQTSAGMQTRILDVTIDFHESLGAHLGVDLINSSDLQFSEDDFATYQEMVTDYKYIPFPRGSSREPVLYLWEWDPVPMTIRGLYPSIEVSYDD